MCGGRDNNQNIVKATLTRRKYAQVVPAAQRHMEDYQKEKKYFRKIFEQNNSKVH